ncbi:hypothetical protein ElyMa_001144000 [Elysia marginata]|uniref:Uncharacterized protein n=1 Tax=Elysia marginata TaxID=1093978 RepID=A0AAV4I005_9GAST|nr:hypothetical protein ElyMa_001144000 [Elysia marginata]
MVEGSVKRSKGLDIEMGCAQRCYTTSRVWADKQNLVLVIKRFPCSALSCMHRKHNNEKEVAAPDLKLCELGPYSLDTRQDG